MVTQLKEIIKETDAKAKKQETRATEVLGVSGSKDGIILNQVENEVGQLCDDCMQEKYNVNSLDESSQRRLFAKIESGE